ncbi:MAG: glycosyltransferase [Cryomorphaceae bacterium]|nr:MAG: glycosyltransferase [Cryomorphaceae bacterium]
MKSMTDKVLVFIDWYLPGFRAGGPTRSCANMVAALGGEFSFYIVTRNTDYCESEPYPDIPENQWIVLPSGERVWYLPEGGISLRTVRQIMESENWSTIYVNGLYSRFFSVYPLLIRKMTGKLNVPVIVAARGMLAASAIGVKKTKKRIFLKTAKLFGLYKGVFFQATHQGEENEIHKEIGPNNKVFVAPNIAQRELLSDEPPEKRQGSLRLISIARIAPEKNLLFLLEALSNVRANVQLSVYGSIYDENYWKSCLRVINAFPDNVRVEVHGVIEPSQIPVALGKHHMLVLPSRGENFGHVIAESMLAGRPVLVSDQTPWKGLEKSHSGKDIPLRMDNWRKAIDYFAGLDNDGFKVWLRGAAQRGQEVSKDPGPVDRHREMFRAVISFHE